MRRKFFLTALAGISLGSGLRRYRRSRRLGIGMWPLRLRLLSSRRGLLRFADLFLCPTDNYGGSPLRGATQLHRAAHIRHSTKSLCQRNGSMPVRL